MHKEPNKLNNKNNFFAHIGKGRLHWKKAHTYNYINVPINILSHEQLNELEKYLKYGDLNYDNYEKPNNAN